MGTILLVLITVLICSGLAGIGFWYAMRRHTPLARPLPFVNPPYRKLTDEELRAVEKYLASLQKNQPPAAGGEHPGDPLTLTAQSHHVYAVTQAITRYGLSTDDPHNWRYYLDETEVHLPPHWEQYITNENYVELICTQTMPLVISLNGHSLPDYATIQTALPSLSQPGPVNASIRQETSDSIELLQVRKETREEYQLTRPDGTREAVAIVFAFLLFLLGLLVPAAVVGWLLGLASVVMAVSVWSLVHIPGTKRMRDIHCLRGTPKRWGLFGESNKEQSNITLGITDLVYPPHWLPYVAHDLGQTTDIEIYLNRQVVRQGRFLSLQDEVRNFPIKRWRKNVVLACGSLLALVLLVSWVPLAMPLKLSLALMKGTESLEVDKIDKLAAKSLRVGDMLTVSGVGMCSLPSSYQNNRSYIWQPFDCSAVYWNNAAPLPLPQSDIVDKATALRDTANRQLHPESYSEARLNPQLASAIQKSGMTLLDDFADLVIKTQQLCAQKQDCVRLKNALVNLGNAKDWETLVRRADSGQLTGTNVLLRPVSAEALENLIKTATSGFFLQETRRAAENLNSPPPGGFLIVSDEGHQLVNQPQPGTPLFSLAPAMQWSELQRLSGLLLQTPFRASGVITGLSIDANGTRHITLHNEPDAMAMWRYLGTTLLLVTLLICAFYNALIALRRIHRNRQRMASIQHYYDRCFNHDLMPALGFKPPF